MRIRFEVTVEDLVSYNLGQTARYRRRKAWVLSVFGSLVPVGFVAYNCLQDAASYDRFLESPLSFVALIVALYFFIATLFLVATLWESKMATERQIRQILNKPGNESMVGWVELEFDRNRLDVRADTFETSFSLSAIQKVVLTKQYAFINTTADGGCLVPLADDSGERIEFVERLREARERWEALPPRADTKSTTSDDRFMDPKR